MDYRISDLKKASSPLLSREAVFLTRAIACTGWGILCFFPSVASEPDFRYSFWERDPERSQESQEELEAALPAGFPDAETQGHSFVLWGKYRKPDSFFNTSTNSKGRCVISLWSCSINFGKKRYHAAWRRNESQKVDLFIRTLSVF